MTTSPCTRLNASVRIEESLTSNAWSMPMLAIDRKFAPVIALTPLMPFSNVAKLRSAIVVQLASSDADSESPRSRQTSATKVGTPMI